MDVRMRTRRWSERSEWESKRKIFVERERDWSRTRSKDRRRTEGELWGCDRGKKVTRTRRATRHANIGFSVRTFGPSGRGNVYSALYFRHPRTDGDGWGKGDVELAMKKNWTHTANNFLRPKFHGDRPIDQRRANNVKAHANVLPIGYRGKSWKSRLRGWFPQVFPFVVTATTCIFISRSKNDVPANIF